MSRSLTGLLLAGAGLLVADVSAQDDELDGFELSPFAVETSGDVGYLSTNSTSGTSLNTPIKDLPMAIQVINQEFLSDYGASNLEEALVYSAGVFTSDTQASSSVGANRGGNTGDRSISSAGRGSRFANVVYIRGLPTPYQNRMGFRYGGLVVTPNSSVALGGMLDSVNMERIEVVKGPNSLLYGVGVLTGIVNVIPKRPLPEPRYEGGIRMGSHGFLRTHADITGPLLSESIPGELNFRLAGSYEESGHWTDFREDKTEYWVAQLEYTPNAWSRIFLEYQDGYTQQQGIGPQWIYDDIGDANDGEFRNAFDEAHNWARHEGPIDGLRPLDPAGFNAGVRTIDDRGRTGTQPGFRMMDDVFVGGGLGPETRMTGPDTYATRDERNFIADFEFYPIEDLTINVGGFWASQETEERSLHFNGASASAPNNFVQNTVRQDAQLRGIWESGGVYGAQMQQVVRDSFGLTFRTDPATTEGDYVLPSTIDDVKLIEYWWRDSVVKSESEQYRARATYRFDTPFFGGGTATHTLLAGYSLLRDKIDFPDGNINRGHAQANRTTDFAGMRIDADAVGRTVDEPYGSDGLYYRSIANFEPIYFDGRNDGVQTHNTVRAGAAYLNQKITQQGFYGVYQGKFFEDRLQLIVGLRKDIYNATEYMHKRADISDDFLRSQAFAAMEKEVTDQATMLAGGDTVLRDSIASELLSTRTATDVYVSNYYRDSIESGDQGYFGYANRGGAADQSYGIVPGSYRDIFERDVEVTTGTIGANYAITPALTIYGVASQGISPNTALRDGNGEIIRAEETFNKEIGIKFDLVRGKISGNLAVFSIDRENAIWNVPIAPAAARWADAQLSPNRANNWTLPTYDPEHPSTYFVRSDYFVDYIANEFGVSPEALNFAQEGRQIQQTVALEDLDPSLPIQERLAIIRDVQSRTLFPAEFATEWNSQAAYGGNLPINVVGINADGLDDMQEITIYNPNTAEFVTKRISSLPILYSAFMDREIDKTKNSLLRDIHPIRYRRFTSFGHPQNNNNVSFDQAQGALVTFDERINGLEFELFLTPTDNLQFVASFTHVKREARDSFQFTEWRSIAGTEGSFVPPFTMLHREFGWEAAGLEGAWVDYDAYAAALANAGGSPLSADSLDGAVEFLPEGTVDQTIDNSTFAARTAAGQMLMFVDREGHFVNEQNSARATDYTDLLDSVSLNFNPETEFALWGKYTFGEDAGWLERVGISAGVKYIGASATSVAFHSVSPINGLTMTPEVPSQVRVDLGLSYRWDWSRVRMRLSLNVYNVFDHTYDVNTTTVDTLNPITGAEVIKRTERYYAPTTFRVGLTASF